MTLAERIATLLADEALDDGQLRQRLEVRHQALNQARRRLEQAGRIARHPGPNGRIVNWLLGSNVPEPITAPEPVTSFCPPAGLLWASLLGYAAR